VHVDTEKFAQNFGWEALREETTWKNNIKLYLRCESVDWI